MALTVMPCRILLLKTEVAIKMFEVLLFAGQWFFVIGLIAIVPITLVWIIVKTLGY